MAIDISNLDSKLKSYLDANRDELLSKALFNSKATTYFSLVTGVKNPQAITILSVEAPLQDGTNCGFSADGDDTFTDRVLTPVPIAVQKEWCPKDWLQTYKAQDLAVAAGRENLPFEEKILNQLAEQISKNVESLVMEGDTNNGDLMDGFETLVEADITSTAIPAGNVIAKASDNVLTRCQKLWNACDAALLDRAEIWMSVANFKTLLTDLINSNLYHIWEQYEGKFEMTLPGTTTIVRGISSITADKIYMFDPKNVFYGVDLENQLEVFDLWFSRDDQLFKLNCQMVVSINYAFPEQIYVNK